MIRRAIANTESYAVSHRERKKVEMLFAHLKRILRLDRLRLRGPSGAKDEFLPAATAQNLRKLAKLVPHPAPIFAILALQFDKAHRWSRRRLRDPLASIPTTQAGSFSASPINVSRLILRRITTAPDASSPTTLQTFLPTSMPSTEISIPSSS
jgi:hypothetical protein